MKQLKTIVAIICLLALCISLFACSGKTREPATSRDVTKIATKAVELLDLYLSMDAPEYDTILGLLELQDRAKKMEIEYDDSAYDLYSADWVVMDAIQRLAERWDAFNTDKDISRMRDIIAYHTGLDLTGTEYEAPQRLSDDTSAKIPEMLGLADTPYEVMWHDFDDHVTYDAMYGTKPTELFAWFRDAHSSRMESIGGCNITFVYYVYNRKVCELNIHESNRFGYSDISYSEGGEPQSDVVTWEALENALKQLENKIS